jgi:endonuclease/exonuclease/phosphatase family metal-dependent hydrolase
LPKLKGFIVSSLLVLLLGCSRRAVHQAAVKQEALAGKLIRVLTYNIHHANPPAKPGVIDLEAVAKVIRAQQPDVVALQEVDVFTERSGKAINQAEELARLTGMKAFFAKAIDYTGGEYGVAILSKLPMEATRNNHLPTAAGTNGELRTLATAVLTLSNGNKFVFASTHLDAQRLDTNRYLQINKITEILRNEKLPVIIAGDLNAVATSRIIKALDAEFVRSCVANCGFTIPQINPNKTIDYIAFKPASKFVVVEHKVVDEPYASDHLPVMAVFQFKK